MQMSMTYCAYKVYKGFFKKTHKGNVHILIIPISPDKVLLLNLVGFTDEAFYTYLIAEIPMAYVKPYMEAMESNHGDKFVVLATIPVKPSEKSKGEYKIKVLVKNDFVKSDLIVSYEPEYSSPGAKVYSITGKLDIRVAETKLGTVKMQATAASAKFKKILTPTG